MTGFKNLSAYLRPTYHISLEGWGKGGQEGEGGVIENAPARFMVHKSGSSHYTLNLLAHVSGRPGAISYSRG